MQTQHVIVGTAGHVDHGKTCLIKALTGTDTDRLAEEQKRGITIELGFASMSAEGGQKVGIIDVPGHERFVKNMLAGIGGIDLVLLVIALDEGVMPQTVEHFEILKMLHIKKGIVVLTKADLVDEDWADLVEEDVAKLLKGSFLEQAPRIRVSAYTGTNIVTLREMILAAVKDVGRRRESRELFRLPIDRVFTMEGFGTVVTGTLLEGCCETGQEIMLYPQERLLKIRGIQNHGQKESQAFAGQRTALNLAGIKKEELERGEILAAPGTLIASFFLDARVRLFSTAERKLKNGDRVHLSYGSAQTIAKAVLLDQDVLESGEEALVQFRFQQPVAVRRGDRFIIRFYSPVETFGGGMILDSCPQKHKRGQAEVIEALRIKESGTEEEVLEQILREQSGWLPTPRSLALCLNETQEETKAVLEGLKHRKKALSLNDGSFIHKVYWEEVVAFTAGLLNDFHKSNPISGGMEKEEVKSRLAEHFHFKEGKEAQVLFDELLKRSMVTIQKSAVAAAGFSARYSGELTKILDQIETAYREAGVEALSADEVVSRFGDQKEARQIVADLAKKGVLVKLCPGVFIHRESWERIRGLLRDHFKEHPELTLAQCRDMLCTSRKYAVLILEFCDQQKLTRMQGDARILLKKEI